jgi:hypothetical protein
MSFGESIDNNAVEVDGVWFETFMPERILPIPAIKFGAYTRVPLGIRIINNTPTPFHFLLFKYFLTELKAPDSQFLQAGYGEERLRISPVESDFVLAMPGEAVIFSTNVILYWRINPKKKRDRKLTLTIPFGGDSEYFSFRSLNPGTYQVQLRYEPTLYGIEDYEYYIELYNLQKVWTGQVVTPPVEFNLVQP